MMPPRKRTWVVLFSTGVVLAALLGFYDATHTEAVAAPSHEPVMNSVVAPYPGSPWADIGGSVSVDRQPRRLGYAVSKDTPEQVAGHFAGIWHAQGLKVEERNIGD